MGDLQEEKLYQEYQEEDNICNSMLHLSTAAPHHPAAAAPYKNTPDSLDNCNATYSHCTKRHSSSSFQEPSSKRAASSPSTASAADYQHLGFTKLPLPHSFSTSTPSPLRRTVSEPIYPANTVNSAASPPQFSDFPNSPGPVPKQPPQEIPNGNVVQESSPFPNAAPFIYRTASDPNPLANMQVAAAGGTPPRPPARNVSNSPSLGDSPSSKRLRRMKERMKEMSQWWNQVVRESDEEDNESKKYNTDHTLKEESENGMENPSQEAVWVEKNGGCLILHFKCPCGHGYQILLSGKNCYYKLTSF